jgi:integrase
VVLDALREHQLRQSAERLAAGAAWQEHGLVFATRIGTPLDARNVVRHYHALLAKAGLPRLRFHDLRHTAASLLLAQGLELRVVQQVLGHSQISLTANLYTHVMPPTMSASAEASRLTTASRRWAIICSVSPGRSSSRG